MIFTFDNKIYSEQPAPSREILYYAVNDVVNYCHTVKREINRAKKLNSYKYIKNFYYACFLTLINKIFAIKKMGSTFRNEVNSISRDLTEIVIDGSWIWYYFDELDNPDLAEEMCKQFYLNHNAHFIANFGLNKQMYLRNPFFKQYYSEKKLDDLLSRFTEIVGTYNYKNNWRHIPDKVNQNDYKWKTRCEGAAVVMEKCANLKNADLYRNLSLLSAFSHWDGMQIESEEEKIEEVIFDHNLNAHIGFIHDFLNLGYHIIEIEIPQDLRLLRQRIIW